MAKAAKKPATTLVNGVPVAAKQAKYLSGDSSYQNSLGQLTAQLAAYKTDQYGARNNYASDEATALSNLGYKGVTYKPGVVTKTNIMPAPTFDLKTGGWAAHDTSGAYGRDLTNQADDFAARGMAGQGDYARAAGDTRQGYLNQLSAISTAGTRYQNDIDKAAQAYQGENQSSQRQALIDALARYAAQYTTLT